MLSLQFLLLQYNTYLLQLKQLDIVVYYDVLPLRALKMRERSCPLLNIGKKLNSDLRHSMFTILTFNRKCNLSLTSTKVYLLPEPNHTQHTGSHVSKSCDLYHQPYTSLQLTCGTNLQHLLHVQKMSPQNIILSTEWLMGFFWSSSFNG